MGHQSEGRGDPLWRLLGARDRFVPDCASALDIGLEGEGFLAVRKRFAERGFRAAKLKGGRYIERDVVRLETLRAIYSARSTAPALMFDANESWHRSQAIRYVARLEERLDITWVEKPVRRWDAAGLAVVRAGVRAGVASGENLAGLERFRPLLDADASDVVQVGWGWGTTLAMRVAAAAHARDLTVSPVGFSPAIAPAAAAMPYMLTIEVQDPAFPTGLQVDQEFDDGGIVLGDTPGNGFSVDEEALALHKPSGDQLAARDWQVRPSPAALRITPEDDSGVDS